MKITKIDWMDEETKEAEVELTDGTFKCLAFACPLSYPLGAIVPESISGFDYTELALVKDRVPLLKRTSESYFSHELCGEVLTINEKRMAIIGIGGFRVHLYRFPTVFKAGNFVHFHVSRLDIS